MKTEAEVRQMIEALRAFNGRTKHGDGIHDHEIRALRWVLGEYPPPPKPQSEAPAPDPHIVPPVFPGGFPVRRTFTPPPPKKESE